MVFGVILSVSVHCHAEFTGVGVSTPHSHVSLSGHGAVQGNQQLSTGAGLGNLTEG